MTKTCIECKVRKDLCEFPFHNKSLGTHRNQCRTCWLLLKRDYGARPHTKAMRREIDRKHHQEHILEDKNRALLWSFGITLEHYNVMVKVQEGRCAICGKPESRIDNRSKKVKSLVVDHNHDTGAIRGLLCDLCNRLLGAYEKRRKESAWENYLQKWEMN